MALYLWKNLKALYTRDYRDLFDATFATEMGKFTSNMRSYPNADPHTWLALTFGARPEFMNAGQGVHFITAVDFSLVEPVNKAVMALTIDILRRTNPAIDVELPGLANRFGELMGPIFEMHRKGTFVQRWKTLNAWTSANMAGLADAVVALSEPQYRGELVHCVWCFALIPGPGWGADVEDEMSDEIRESCRKKYGDDWVNHYGEWLAGTDATVVELLRMENTRLSCPHCRDSFRVGRLSSVGTLSADLLELLQRDIGAERAHLRAGLTSRGQARG
jgi:hypothetical protein